MSPKTPSGVAPPMHVSSKLAANHSNVQCSAQWRDVHLSLKSDLNRLSAQNLIFKFVNDTIYYFLNTTISRWLMSFKNIHIELDTKKKHTMNYILF
jgi:hypothetical protein